MCSLFSVSADDDKNKSTVSVIRVGSPTPSMESKENSSDQEDDDDEERSDEDKDNDSEVSDEDDDADSETEKSRKSKKNKKKNKARGVSLIVEEFYNPQQAVALATEIKSKIKFSMRINLSSPDFNVRISDDNFSNFFDFFFLRNRRYNKSKTTQSRL